MFRIYDLNNWVRVQIEQDPSGSPIRSLYMDTQTAPCPVIWVADGKGANERRRARYPLYKANREPQGENIFVTMGLMKEIVRLSKGILIEIPGYEADDVIAALARKHRDCLIFSTDGDLIQLQTDPTVKTVKGEFKKGRIPPKHIRAYKTLVGDVSDNIKGVPGFGEKAFEEFDVESFITMMQTKDAEALEYIAAKPKPKAWMRDNFDALLAMWEITGFYPVSPNLIEKHAKIGTDNSAAVMGLFQEFML